MGRLPAACCAVLALFAAAQAVILKLDGVLRPRQVKIYSEVIELGAMGRLQSRGELRVAFWLGSNGTAAALPGDPEAVPRATAVLLPYFSYRRLGLTSTPLPAFTGDVVCGGLGSAVSPHRLARQRGPQTASLPRVAG